MERTMETERVPADGGPDVAAVLRRLVAQVSGASADEVRGDRSVVQYGVDSLRAMELIVLVEEAFGISVPDDCLATLTTMDQVTAFVTAKIEER